MTFCVGTHQVCTHTHTWANTTFRLKYVKHSLYNLKKSQWKKRHAHQTFSKVFQNCVTRATAIQNQLSQSWSVNVNHFNWATLNQQIALRLDFNWNSHNFQHRSGKTMADTWMRLKRTGGRANERFEHTMLIHEIWPAGGKQSASHSQRHTHTECEQITINTRIKARKKRQKSVSSKTEFCQFWSLAVKQVLIEKERHTLNVLSPVFCSTI